ncbi:MAG TPA: hypothetical protein VHV78_04330, partial [Gemmatimonadaceae bacterium]|nr:hypothetical protein [Gemmatimonadaceae bacterium]
MTRRERNLKPRHAKTAAPRAPLALWIPIALALLAIVVFAPAWRAPFEFDDIASIPGNPTIRTLWPASVPLNPPANTSVAGRPVVNVSLALNYAVNEWLGVDQRPDPYGPNKTVGYHAVNLLLHIGCALLLLGIIRRTLLHGAESHGWTANPNLLPVIAAALWVVHPIQTEAVDYIVQRTELVASACYLAALYLAIRAWEAGNRRATTGWRFAAVAVCLVGMGSKEIMVTAPFIVALYDRAFRVSSWKELLADRQRLVFYGALVATMTLAISLVAVNSRHGTVGFGLGVPWYRYFYSQAWAILHYLKLTAWPDQLTFDYGQRPIAGLAGVPGLLVLGAAFVATIVAWIRAERWAWAGFLGAWFFLTLAPSSSVVPITTEIAAERRVYLALAAVAVLVVIGADTLRRSIASRATREDARRWTLPATIVVGLVYVASSGWEAGRLAADHVALAWALRAGIGALAAGLVVVVLRSARPSLAVGGILLALGATTIDRCLAYENP